MQTSAIQNRDSLLRDVEALLYREARLLDDGRFDEWLQLFTDDACYWCPANRYDIDPNHHVSIIYDDRRRMGERVWRITESGNAFAQQPPSRTSRQVTNVELLGEQDGDLVVRSRFLLLEVRRGKQNIWGGGYEHRLRAVDGTLLIARKKVELVNNDLPVDNLAFLL